MAYSITPKFHLQAEFCTGTNVKKAAKFSLYSSPKKTSEKNAYETNSQ